MSEDQLECFWESPGKATIETVGIGYWGQLLGGAAFNLSSGLAPKLKSEGGDAGTSGLLPPRVQRIGRGQGLVRLTCFVPFSFEPDYPSVHPSVHPRMHAFIESI